LALALLDVVAERLLLDAGANHLLLVLSELLVGHRRLLRLPTRTLAIEIFLEVLCVSQRCSFIKVGLQSSLHDWQLALHARVPVVLDGVVGAALEDLGDLSPLVVDDAVHQEEDPLFLFVPVNFLDARVQVIVPALSALLSHAAVQML